MASVTLTTGVTFNPNDQSEPVMRLSVRVVTDADGRKRFVFDEKVGRVWIYGS